MTNKKIEFYQIDEITDLTVTLSGSNPPIFRQIEVRSDMSLFDLHCIIQIAMGWTHSHLFEFKRGDLLFGVNIEEFAGEFPDMIEAQYVPIAGLLKRPGQILNYIYDLGDYWDHKIRLNRHLPVEPEKFYPCCIAGAENCPPEDCGGIHGFYEMVKILSDTKHPEHKEMKRWVGERFNKKEFDLSATNNKLKKINSVIRDFTLAYNSGS